MTEVNSKKDICTFDYSLRVMIDHAGTTFTRPTGTTSLTYKRSIKFPQGEGCVRYQTPYNWGVIKEARKGFSLL